MDHYTTLQTEVASLLLENLNVEVPSVHHDLIEIGLLDSLKIVELLVELEQRFEMKIPLDDLEIHNFRSVASIARFVENMKAWGMPSAATSVSPCHATRSPVAD